MQEQVLQQKHATLQTLAAPYFDLNLYEAEYITAANYEEALHLFVDVFVEGEPHVKGQNKEKWLKYAALYLQESITNPKHQYLSFVLREKASKQLICFSVNFNHNAPLSDDIDKLLNEEPQLLRERCIIKILTWLENEFFMDHKLYVDEKAAVPSFNVSMFHAFFGGTLSAHEGKG